MMQAGTHNDHKDTGPSMLEIVLRLHGDFRRILEPIRVTPLQAGVLLYLHRRADARLTEAAAALRVQTPTMADVVQDLVRKRWVTKRPSSRIAVRCVCVSVGGGRPSPEQFTIRSAAYGPHCPNMTEPLKADCILARPRRTRCKPRWTPAWSDHAFHWTR